MKEKAFKVSHQVLGDVEEGKEYEVFYESIWDTDLILGMEPSCSCIKATKEKDGVRVVIKPYRTRPTASGRVIPITRYITVYYPNDVAKKLMITTRVR